jgi:hypothetical protein
VTTGGRLLELVNEELFDVLLEVLFTVLVVATVLFVEVVATGLFVVVLLVVVFVVVLLVYTIGLARYDVCASLVEVSGSCVAHDELPSCTRGCGSHTPGTYATAELALARKIMREATAINFFDVLLFMLVL